MRDAMQLDTGASFALPADIDRAILVGRVFRRGEDAIDISFAGPTMRDLCEAEAPARLAREASGESLGRLADILANTPRAARNPRKPWLLAPIDLQAVRRQA
jgi:fumarylacetoacetate (FAA) hydrolase family protein